MINSTFKRNDSGVLRTAKFPKVSCKPIKRLKSNQRAVTAEEKAIWSRMAESGCTACYLDGNHNTYVSIHHIDGRTKPGCHMRVIPLCAPHHQHDDTDPAGRIGIHPNKSRFEHKYGTQQDLLALTMQRIEQ